jgi:fused signal recognition particle receptor
VSFFSGIKQRLTDGLRRSQEFLATELKTVFESDRPIDDTLFEELEEILIAADIGAALAADFKHRAKEEQMYGTLTRAAQLRPLFRRFLIDTLSAKAASLELPHRPTVILMLGVNGAGKTTTCAKLAAQLKDDGKTVLLAAADTFRAAAIEQLQTWGTRVGVEVIHQTAGSDPAAVVFDAVKAATARRVDALIIDTAGRLHTKSNLMDELIKLKRVAERQLPGAPHESLMVLDAPTGQNGFAQATMFHQAIGLTGLCLTKLDGTAKGGIVIAIARKLKLPIRFIGVGEQAEDFGEFDARAFANALVSGNSRGSAQATSG